jgi:hypothetical protein
MPTFAPAPVLTGNLQIIGAAVVGMGGVEYQFRRSND